MSRVGIAASVIWRLQVTLSTYQKAQSVLSALSETHSKLLKIQDVPRWWCPNDVVRAWSARTLTTQNDSIRLPESLKLTPGLEERLHCMSQRFEQLEKLMMGQIESDSSATVQDVQKEHGRLSEAVSLWRDFCKARSEVLDLEILAHDSDPEMAKEAREELHRLKNQVRQMEVQLLLTFLPQHDQDEQRGAIVEVRAGAGGAEASLFAAELLEMYTKLAAGRHWRSEVLEVSSSDLGGVRTGSVAVSGLGAYQQLRWESGVHRVQRVPVTETAGRLHTSTASVVVLPEANEVDVSIKSCDLHIETYRASGAGGQHVNTTSTAVRVTHIPSGIVVSCQDERSQIRNKDKALRLLRSRVMELERRKAEQSQDAARRAQTGTGERNERIRTYNFAQDRVTDHRVNMTHHGITDFMSGSVEIFDEIHSALQLQEQAQQLEQLVAQDA